MGQDKFNDKMATPTNSFPKLVLYHKQLKVFLENRKTREQKKSTSFIINIDQYSVDKKILHQI